MSKNLNSASRLIALLQQAAAQSDNTPVLEVWANLFALTETNQNRKAIAVAERLRSMHRELDIVSDQLRNASFSTELYEGHLSRIEHALSTMLLPGTWNQVKQYLPPDVLTALAFCSEILPDEETQISEQELAEIKSKVEELRATLDDATIPPRLSQLIRHHIELIEHALAEYPIAGAKAFREAGRAALGEIIEAKDTISASRETPAVSQLESTWKTVNQATDIALKAEKLAQLGQKAWDMIAGIF